MPYYRKRPVVIDATRLTEDTVIKTLEGDMVGRPGDWLITGVTGEKYPCGPDTFAKTYEPVGEGRFRKRPVAVEAIRLSRPISIKTGQGTLVGEPGSWLVSGVNGSQYPVKNDIFEATYELLSPDLVAPS